ncbi:MAG TPA: hypothetical protein VHN38_11175, partial [Immundisolibacter sp.]|nr:hypothetical protein [Immundisolibacter sp.]
PQLRSVHLLLGAFPEADRAAHVTPARLQVYGIEGADFGSGEGLSPAVAAAAGALVEELLIELTEACRA